MTTATSRKVRSDAKLEQLAPAQHTQLLIWLDDENLSYAEVVRRLREEFGVSVGRTAVAHYYQRHVQPQRCEIESEAAAVLARMKEGPFDAAAVNHARMLAFSALVQPQPEIDTAAKLLNMVRRAEQQAIARERLELQRRLVAVRERQVGIRSRRKGSSLAEVVPRSETEPFPAPPLPVETPAVESHSVAPPCVPAFPLAATCPPPAALGAPSEAGAGPTTPAPADVESVAPHAAAVIDPTPSVAPSPIGTSQNSPLYSPYFALNRSHPAADFAPIIEVAIHGSSPAAVAGGGPAPDAACSSELVHQPDAACAA